ncbi:MAG TPA: hypothetical protein VFF40_08205 [Acidimicrobiia bacterium]|nr:hypothetical protein [Acidimicrobiia bacterium]
MEHRANPVRHVHPTTGATDGDHRSKLRGALAFRTASHDRTASALPASWRLSAPTAARQTAARQTAARQTAARQTALPIEPARSPDDEPLPTPPPSPSRPPVPLKRRRRVWPWSRRPEPEASAPAKAERTGPIRSDPTPGRPVGLDGVFAALAAETRAAHPTPPTGHQSASELESEFWQADHTATRGRRGRRERARAREDGATRIGPAPPDDLVDLVDLVDEEATERRSEVAESFEPVAPGERPLTRQGIPPESRPGT